MLTMSTFSLLLPIYYLLLPIYLRNTQALVRASTRDAYNLYSLNFLNHRFHTIGKYVQNYRYRLSTDMANIGPIPIPTIGQSRVEVERKLERKEKKSQKKRKS